MKNVNFILLILVIRKKYWRGEKRFHLTMSSIQHRRLIYLTGELFFPFFYVILLISIHVEHNYFHALGLFQMFLPLTSLLDFVKKKNSLLQTWKFLTLRSEPRNLGNLYCTHRIVSTKYFCSSTILYSFLWMFSGMREIVKMRVWVGKTSPCYTSEWWVACKPESTGVSASFWWWFSS